jgi:hypothetical protein
LRTKAIVILLIVIFAVLIVPTSASSVSMTIDKKLGQVQAIFRLSLQQNITQLPNQTSALNLSNDPQLASSFSNALKANSTAVPSDVTMDITSKGTSLSITTIMTVSGVSQRRGDILAVDMGWKGFNVTADLRAGNLSYNTMGSRYFLPVVDFYTNATKSASRPNATITGVSFFINRTSVGPRTAENYAGNFTIFDFTDLKSPLEQWQRTYSLSNDTTKWQYAPLQRFDFAIATQHQNRTTVFDASYAYDAEITVSGLARAHGDTLMVDAGTGQREWIMAGIIAIAIVLAIATQLLFRAKKKKYAKFGRW